LKEEPFENLKKKLKRFKRFKMFREPFDNAEVFVLRNAGNI